MSWTRSTTSGVPSTAGLPGPFVSGYWWIHTISPAAAFMLLSAFLQVYSVLQAPGYELSPAFFRPWPWPWPWWALALMLAVGGGVGSTAPLAAGGALELYWLVSVIIVIAWITLLASLIVLRWG
ncbi:Proline-rich transmembrane protein 4, partial [Ophiophagus hannah]